jgi:hypothetical protein
MIVAAKLCGKWENSEDFSFVKDKFVSVFGTDRGDDNTTTHLRVANRGDENCGDICQPITQYETGMENHANLAKTTYNPRYSVKPFLQRLIKDKLFGITIDVIKQGRIIGSQCKVLRLFVKDENKELEEEIRRLLPLFM